MCKNTMSNKSDDIVDIRMDEKMNYFFVAIIM